MASGKTVFLFLFAALLPCLSLAQIGRLPASFKVSNDNLQSGWNGFDYCPNVPVERNLAADKFLLTKRAQEKCESGTSARLIDLTAYSFQCTTRNGATYTSRTEGYFICEE